MEQAAPRRRDTGGERLRDEIVPKVELVASRAGQAADAQVLQPLGDVQRVVVDERGDEIGPEGPAQHRRDGEEPVRPGSRPPATGHDQLRQPQRRPGLSLVAGPEQLHQPQRVPAAASEKASEV